MRLGMHGSSVCHRKRSRILCSCGTRSTHVPLRDVCFRDVIESSLGSVCRRWPTAGVFTMMSSKRSSDPRPALARMAAVRGAPVVKLPPLRQDSGPQSTPPHPGRPGEWNSSSAVYRAASTASRTAVPALGRGWTSRRVRLTEPVTRSSIEPPHPDLRARLGHRPRFEESFELRSDMRRTIGCKRLPTSTITAFGCHE